MLSGTEKFFAINTIAICSLYFAYVVVINRNNEKLYKKTLIFKEAMDKLRSHRGAVHYLGQSIDDGKLTVLKVEKDDEKTRFHVKVAVRGTDGAGNMYFWLSRKNNDSDAQLNRIELKLLNMKKRLLILDRNETLMVGDNGQLCK